MIPAPCPFCGRHPYSSTVGKRDGWHVRCESITCYLRWMVFSWDAWHSRRGQSHAEETLPQVMTAYRRLHEAARDVVNEHANHYCHDCTNEPAYDGQCVLCCSIEHLAQEVEGEVA